MKYLGIFLFILCQNFAWAQTESVRCETPRSLHRFLLHDNSIEILDSRDLQGAARSPAAVANLINRNSGQSLIRVAQYQGHRYRFEFKFNAEGYLDFAHLNLRNNQGHEVTYPLDCTPESF